MFGISRKLFADKQNESVRKMNNIESVKKLLLAAMLLFLLSSCATADTPSDTASATTSATSAVTTAVTTASAQKREIIQPDPEHPIADEDSSFQYMAIENYDAAHILYSSRDLYVALNSTNSFLPGLANESIEGGGHFTGDGFSGTTLLEVGFTVERPHDGGTLEGVRISFTYDTVNESVSGLEVQDFLGTDGVLYTIDYTEENALECGRLLYKIVDTFEQYIELNR